MLQKSSEKYKIPLDFYLTVGSLESNLGTKGRGKDSKNPYNIGNVTWADGLPTVCDLGTLCLDSWETGIDKFASLIYACYFEEGETITIDKWIERDFKAVRCNVKGKRYMTSNRTQQTYPPVLTDIRQILNQPLQTQP